MIFDESQRAVIALTAGTHKVFAPPGSGKTEILTTRSAEAVARGIAPTRMACLTFTNRAARVMKERMPAACEGVFVGNFHAYGVRYLRDAGLFPLGGAILDEEDAHQMSTEAVRSTLGGRHKRRYAELGTRPGPSDLTGMLKLFTNASTRHRLALDREAIEEAEMMLGGRDSLTTMRRRRPRLYRFLVAASDEYTRQKDAVMGLDFDDILNMTAHHLSVNPGGEPLPLDWLQVDEAQDLNAVQWLILRLAVREGAHVTLLGDERQSIFSFMGSSLPRLRTSTKAYGAHTLTTNYRSPPRLLRFFNNYAQNFLGSPLLCSSAQWFDPTAGSLRLIRYESDDQETRDVAARIAPGHTCEGDSVAILARTNGQAVRLSDALDRSGQPHFLVSLFDLFRTANTKDFMAFLTILRRGGNRIAWSRVLRLFGAASTLKASRNIVNELFEAAVGSDDLLLGISDSKDWGLRPLMKLLKKERVVVFDVETTGLDPGSADIVQIAAVELLRGRPGRTLNLYLKTVQPLGSSSPVHGISPEKLSAEGVARVEGLDGFAAFAAGDPLVAHNLPFDWEMLQANLVRSGLAPLPEATERYCTLRSARALYPRAPRHTLESLLDHLKIDGTNSHDALDDALATASLLGRICADARRKSRPASRALRSHRAALARLGKTLPPLVEKLSVSPGRTTTFSEVFDTYSFHIKKTFTAYKWRHEDALRSKLIRHMEITCEPASLSELLFEHLHHYTVCRESDLILDGDRLVVSTVHRAKGLEFDTVIVPGVVENTYPSYFAVTSGEREQIDEEARTFYVAISRARKNLIVTHHDHSGGPGRPGFRSRSRFLRGMDVHFTTEDLTRSAPQADNPQ